MENTIPFGLYSCIEVLKFKYSLQYVYSICLYEHYIINISKELFMRALITTSMFLALSCFAFAADSPLQINLTEKYTGNNYGDIPLTHLEMEITSKADKVTIKKVTVNRGNSQMKCELKEYPPAYARIFEGSPGYGNFPSTIRFGETWFCSGPKEKIIEVIVDTSEFGSLKYNFK